MFKAKAHVIFWAGGTILALLGVLIFVLGAANVDGTVYSTHTINYFGKYNWTYITIDVYGYLKGLEKSIALDQFNDLTLNIPNLPNIPKSTDIVGWLAYVGRILSVFVPNILIMIMNIMITPMKILVYPIRILTCLLGIDGYKGGVIEIASAIYKFNIPFIPYW